MSPVPPSREQELHVLQVRSFFRDLMRSIGILVTCVLVWLLFAHTWYFWPGWVLVGVAIAFGVRAHGLGLLPFIGGTATARAAEIVVAWEQANIERLTALSQTQDPVAAAEDGAPAAPAQTPTEPQTTRAKVGRKKKGAEAVAQSGGHLTRTKTRTARSEKATAHESTPKRKRQADS
jgi:hypothetical protein